MVINQIRYYNEMFWCPNW